jgi:hypothetical protein
MAGRKSLKDEAVMADVINKSWMTLRDILNSKVVPQESKNNIAIRIAEKSIPKDINLSGGLYLNCLPKITIGKKKLEFEFDTAAGAGTTGHPTEADPDNN